MFPSRIVDEELSCGLFTVPKDELRDRLVLDARPRNAFEEAESTWVRSLGSLAQLHYLFLDSAHDLQLHTEDLKDFYHSFIVGEERALRNCLRIRVHPDTCLGLSAMTPALQAESMLVPALRAFRSMAMGDTSAVGLAQCAHLGVVLSTGCVDLSSFITLEGRPPRQGPTLGLMIDDLLVMDPVPRGSWPKHSWESRGRRIIETIRTAYETVGLPRHSGKAVEYSFLSNFWGCQCNGRTGCIRPSLQPYSEPGGSWTGYL